MSREEAMARLDRALDGIDRDEMDAGGWWETSVGVLFGASRLADVRKLIEDLTEPTPECPYDFAHTRDWCGYAGCRESGAAPDAASTTT